MRILQTEQKGRSRHTVKPVCSVPVVPVSDLAPACEIISPKSPRNLSGKALDITHIPTAFALYMDYTLGILGGGLAYGSVCGFGLCDQFLH